MTKGLHKYIGIGLTFLMGACAYDDFEDPSKGGSDIINLASSIEQQYITRANDEGFADGDVIGIYIVDYQGNNPGTLQNRGNRADNVRYTFNESSNSWKAAYDVYWKDKHTPVDIYGYYPFSSPESVNNFTFSVKANQARTYDNGTMSDYEASDFLWGKVGGVAPTSNLIRVPLSHKLANARVTLVEGSGFDNGEWQKAKKEVLVTNTTHDCVMDLSTGEVIETGSVSQNAIIPAQKGDDWRAIVIPQSVAAGTSLFSITIDGTPYTFSRNEEFSYIAGKMSNFSIRVDKKIPEGTYTLTLISESITPWENDLMSHDATAREYIVVNASPGNLKKAIVDSGYDYSTVRNLKVTGQIDARDFYFMRDEMIKLQALNLKEVEIVAGYGQSMSGSELRHENDEIPAEAMFKHKTLSRLILPDKLKSLNKFCFHGCGNLIGSLTIPEGVTKISSQSFYDCPSLTGTLYLPTTLTHIGSSAFYGCGFNCELTLPDNLEVIENDAFDRCTNLYGKLKLPQSIKTLGVRCFSNCKNLIGDLEIPQAITEIPQEAFALSGFDGTLTLHDGITSIGIGAFKGCDFRGELVLPKDLTRIEEHSFSYCNFSGKLVLPKNLIYIGKHAFYQNTRLSGTLEFPEELATIDEYAFSRCWDIEALIFSKNIDNIGIASFLDCFGISSIVCNSPKPPFVQQNAFDGVLKDAFTLEVPETALTQYQTANGWRDFKRIAAHHLLICRPAKVSALSGGHQQTIIVDAEGEWELMSKPEWCELSPTSGNKKTEVTLTVKPSSKSVSSREGEIVFCLKEDDYYTYSCHISQYAYEHDEDEFIELQRASKGNNGGINIVILGDGYDAADISKGTYLNDMKEQIEHFFAIEPYTTYRDYFNVYTAISVSTETGVGTKNTICHNRFGTTFKSGVGMECDEDGVLNYVLNAPTVSANNLNQTLIIIVPNTTDYGGTCLMWASGVAIAICPKSTSDYPYDSRGVIQHEAGGHGFGKLADEYIYYNNFVDPISYKEIQSGKGIGWYDNIELTGKMHQVGWHHLIFDPRYSDIVDIFEGGYTYSKGVFRSELSSCMNNNIPYFSTISRESIVKRIKRYAGETFNFEEFAANDKRGVTVNTRSALINSGSYRHSYKPVIHKGAPKISKK